MFICALVLVQTIRAGDTPEFVPGSWTLVVLPDTQRYTVDPDISVFGSLTQWIADNKDARNIQFVMHEGDITQGNTTDRWQVASDAMAILDNANISYSLATGNHDYDQWVPTYQSSPSRATLLNNYFPVSRFQAMPTFGGVFEPGKMENSYHLFSAGDTDYVALSLEWGPRNEALAWADGVLTQYADRTALIVTHAYTYTDGTRYDWAKKGTSQEYNPHCSSYGFSAPHNGSENVNDGQQIWDKLVSKHANAKIVFSGHLDWGARQEAVGNHGNIVHEMMAAYHDPPQGWLRLLEFNPDGESVQVKTYSPTLNQYMTDGNNQFTLWLTGDEVVRPGHVEGGPVVNNGTTPYAWYRADTGAVTYNHDSARVGYLADQSGHDRHLTACGGGALLTEEGIGGRQVIALDGFDDYFQSVADEWGTAAPGTVFAVWKRTGGFGPGAHVRYVYDAAGDGSGDATGHRQFFSVGQTGSILAGGAVYTTTFESHYTVDGVLADTIGGDNWAVTSMSNVTGSADTIWINDETVYTGDLRSGGMAGIKIGCYMRDIDKLALQGYVAEVIVFEGELSNSERLAITQQLMQRWGIAYMWGDANNDGFVNELDARALAENWLVQENATWAMGDFNGDYKVDDLDAAILAANWGKTSSSSVPEPGFLAMIIGGVFFLLFVCKR